MNSSAYGGTRDMHTILELAAFPADNTKKGHKMEKAKGCINDVYYPYEYTPAWDHRNVADNV